MSDHLYHERPLDARGPNPGRILCRHTHDPYEDCACRLCEDLRSSEDHDLKRCESCEDAWIPVDNYCCPDCAEGLGVRPETGSRISAAEYAARVAA